jgi:hypothetical protein
MFLVDMPSIDDLLRTAGFSIAAALLAFELVVAARSWYDARSPGRGRDRAAPWVGQPDHGQLLLSQAAAIRGHISQRRPTVRAMRRRYSALGSERYGRQLRRAIGRMHPALPGDPAACPWCRSARLKGQGHCLECGRRLIVAPLPARA